MRLSVFIALILTYVVGCLAAAFAAVIGWEWIVGDLGSLSVLVFGAIVVARRAGGSGDVALQPAHAAPAGYGA